MKFDHRGGEDGLAVLQLRKWGLAEFPYMPSDFREGFISPTRKFLLLHSHSFEALLLPLVKDKCMISKESEILPDQKYHDQPEPSHSAVSVSSEKVPCSPEPVGVNTDIGYTSRVSYLEPHHGYISHVDSVAWGLCGNTFDHQKEDSFEELLFVSGKHGIVVHAFPKLVTSSKGVKPAQEHNVGQMIQVEWGPSATLSPNVEVQKNSISQLKVSRQRLNTPVAEAMDGGLSSSIPRKIWLNTLFTNVETKASNNGLYTRFPKRPSFTNNMVLSFRIFDEGSELLDFLHHGFPASFDQEHDAMPSLSPIYNKTDVNPNIASFRLEDYSASKSESGIIKSSYTCSKVFSNNSHSLVGFALCFSNEKPVSRGYVNGGNCNRVVIAVANLVSTGLHWLFSAKLDENPDRGSLLDWKDFSFSHRFLICLNASGFISLYGATSGMYVASIDVLSITRPTSSLSSQELRNDCHSPDKMNGSSCYQVGSLASKRRFKCLFVFPYSSLLGVMDEGSVVYVVVVDDHIPENHCLFENVVAHQEYPELGLLTRWEVGASEIGYQRDLLNIQVPQDNDLISIQGKNSLFGKLLRKNHLKSDVNIKYQSSLPGLSISNSSTTHKMRGKNILRSCLVRKVYLPQARQNEEDLICCSSFGVTRLIKRYNDDKKWSQLVHSDLQIEFIVNDETNYSVQGREASVNEAVGCNFGGFLYLITEEGLSVVLPSISVPTNLYPVEAIGYKISTSYTKYADYNLLEFPKIRKPWPPWKLEVLDRVLIYEGPAVAAWLCLENGWGLRISHIRHLQLALDYLKFDEIENSLEMLMRADLVVEGILRLLFAAASLMFYKVSNDSEVSAASRLLAMGTVFATRVIRKCGLLQHKGVLEPWDVRFNEGASLALELKYKRHDKEGNSRNLNEMAQLLVVIRNMQGQFKSKFKRPGQIVTGNAELPNMVHTELPEDTSMITFVSEDALLLDASEYRDIPGSEVEPLALVPTNKTGGQYLSDHQNFDDELLVLDGSAFGQRTFPVENPKEMMARWELENLDLKTVVNDALFSGRLPLAVLRLHLHRLNNLVPEPEAHDTFNDIRIAGRAIAYDLFLKGEIGLATTTLQKLGEDVETTLKHLVFGTVRRSLRVQVAEQIERYTYLEPHELKRLEMLSLIERVYPCSSFFNALDTRHKEFKGASSDDTPGETSLQVSHPLFGNLTIACGEVDGVVLGAWTNVDEHTFVPEVDDDSSHAAYWAAAVAWSDAWDQSIIDRVLLDQPLLMGVNVLWESQLEYHICHHNWLEVSKLLEVIPSYALSSGSLSISLDDIHSASEYGQELHRYNNYQSFLEELNTVCMEIPGIKVFRFGANRMCSMWLRTLMEQQLAKSLIFLTEYWRGTADIVPILAQSGFIMGMHDRRSLNGGIGVLSDSLIDIGDASHNPDTVQALHKVVIRFCCEYNLLNFLDLYLDFHKLANDLQSLSVLQDAAGDNEWAKCLLFMRVKGKEYDASFSNVRAVAAQSIIAANKTTVLESDNVIQAVDDIAEGAGEIAALATLMFAPIALQECLSAGSVNRQCSSAQCTLENLKPALQRFPTLWNTLVAACFGQDPVSRNSTLQKKVTGYSDLLDSLNWREGVFFSSTRDTSILQMIPSWFPNSVRRLIQLYVQGPIGWQSLADSENGELAMIRDIYYIVSSSGHGQISALSWESAVQKHIEEELYTSSLEGAGVGLEHHLHRGRALASLNYILSARVHKLKSESKKLAQSDNLSSGQSSVQSDLHTLLAPVNQSEESLLSSVVPLAIEHFGDTVLVASCAFLLELCGLSAITLRINIAALRRISSFYKSADSNYRQMSPKASALYSTSVEVDVTESLARALADDYRRKCSNNVDTCSQPSRAILLVLHHLETASLPFPSNGMTCGSWLSSGNGNGVDLRSQQKVSSQHWKLVTMFCQMHNIPLSTKYLAALARDNDWVGFLSEAQLGRYAFETVIQVASKEISDPRLKVHMSTILKSMLSKKKLSSSSNMDTVENRGEAYLSEENTYIPVELFQILAECEKQGRSGEALLVKAKDLGWSILAMIASCFPDVSPLTCLTVWLEITAARETSAIKVNDIASLIAKNVGAAVESTNSLPASARTVTVHYNRKNSKRRRVVEAHPVDSFPLADVKVSTDSGAPDIQDVIYDRELTKLGDENNVFSADSHNVDISLSRMVAVLCEQHLFLHLLQAFEIFLPSCSLLPFIRALQAFSQMRLSEASAHLESFATRIKEESPLMQPNSNREGRIENSWIISTAVKAADAMLTTCPSPYDKRCLLRLLAATDFGDGGSITTRYGRLCWKIDMAEPSLRSDDCPLKGNETLDDASLLKALEKNGSWEQARIWANQLEASGESKWKAATNHVTEMQAEAMVAEWKEFLWDVPEERVALWSHCQALFIKYSFPANQAGLFFLKHAEAAEKDIPTTELLDLLLLALQWLSGMITLSNPCYPLHLLREIETRVWLLAVESEAHVKDNSDYSLTYPNRESGAGKSSLIGRTATVITKMDNHINSRSHKHAEKNDKDNIPGYDRVDRNYDSGFSSIAGRSTKPKKRAKVGSSRRSLFDAADKKSDSESITPNMRDDSPSSDDNSRVDESSSRWEERVGPEELERAVLSLLDFGQTTAARQLQNKLSPDNIPSQFLLADAALKLASLSTPRNTVSISMLDGEVLSVLRSCNILASSRVIDPLEALEILATILMEGSGRGLCKKIISVVKAANVLGLTFSEAFEKQPIELLQLLTLKAQESFEEANLLVQTNSMSAASIAQVLAESFLKGLLAAHRGGYMDSQKDEGPAPLLWRFSDFLKWAELCPSDSEVGHALMKLVITGQEIPHACEVELLILSHRFYKSSACLDGVDVLVSLAATRVEAYVLDGDFSCLARLITGVGNFHALNFILGILIENGQLDLLLHKYSADADANSSTAEAVRGFRMAVLTSLKQFNPDDLDGFAMVYNHFDMKHETAALLEQRAKQSSQQWFHRYDKDQNFDLLESMCYFIEAAEVHSSIDAGNKTRKACAQASLVSLQIRMPDTKWVDLTLTQARRILVEQPLFQEALIVAEAYDLNQPSEWALVLWAQMLNPEVTEQLVADFVAVLPLQPSMLVELARFYRSEMQARGDQSQLSVWLKGGGLPADWAKYLARSFRTLLRRTRDFRLKLQLANTATGFGDVIQSCFTELDKVPDNAGPLILRKGHGGGYLPLM